MNDSTNSSTGRGRKSSRNRNLAIAGVVLVAAGGWYGVHKYRANAAAEGEYIFASVQKGDIEDLVTSTGALQPRDYVDVGAQVSGQIEKLYVEVGDTVKQGDPLADIDATSSEARVEANKASLRSSQTNLETQKGNLEKADRDYKRQLALLKEDGTTQETVQNAKTTFENAQRSIITSQAQIDQQIANMRIEETNLKYTQIKAPIAGTVMSIAVKQGQTVNATQAVPNVMRIANLATMTVQSDVSEADVAKLYKGIPVYFTTLSGGNRRWTSTLKRVEPNPKVQNSVVLYNALFDIGNEDNSLKAGLTAQVYFINAEARNVLMVPMAAMQQGQQISRQLEAKNKDSKDKKGATPAAGVSGAAPGTTPAATTAAAAPAAAPGATGSAPATTQANAGAGTTPAAAAPGAAAGEGNRPGMGQGNRQGMRAGGQQGGGGGFRPGGFNGQQITPEQMEQFRAARAQRGGQGGFGGGGFGGMGAAGAGAGARPAQRRNGTVMVKKADGTLEARKIVYGVTNRVQAQVLEGLKEGEEVVVGKHEKEAAPGTPSQPQQNQNQNQNRPGNFQGGGFPGGGRF